MNTLLRLVRAAGALTLFINIVLAGSAATAAPSAEEQAESSIKQGVALRRAGNDEAALPEFKTAYELTHSARSAAQLGLCEQALGLWAEAHDHLSEALVAANDAWVKKNRAVLEEQMATANNHIGRVEINGEPVGALVFVDGRKVGETPLSGPIKLAAGRIRIELRAAGYEPSQEALELRPGAYERLGIRLIKKQEVGAASAPSVAQSSLGNSSRRTSALEVHTEQREASVAREEPRSRRAWWAWVAAGAVVIGGAAAAALLVSNNQSSSIAQLHLGPEPK